MYVVNTYKHLTVLSNYVYLTLSSSVSVVSKIHTINNYHFRELKSYPENEGGKKKKPTLEFPDWSLLSAAILKGEKRGRGQASIPGEDL